LSDAQATLRIKCENNLAEQMPSASTPRSRLSAKNRGRCGGYIVLETDDTSVHEEDPIEANLGFAPV
jgi:hypothetical protein